MALKTTTRLIDIIQSELIEKGENEFYNKINGIDQLTYFMPEYAFIRKIMKYTPNVKEILDRMIYNDISLDDEKADLFFKKAFINRFYSREIGQETIELFAGQLTHYYITHEDYIINLHDNYKKFMVSGTHSATTDSTQNGTNSGTADLPQDEPTLDLTTNIMNYANTNTVNRGFNNKGATGDTSTFDPAKLSSIMRAWDVLFKDIDKKLFLQTL